MGVDSEDDNKHEEVAYGHRVDVVLGVDVDTYKGELQVEHLEGGSVDAEVGGMDTPQQLEENVDTVVELK